MNLLESMMESCVILDKVSVSDGMGGFTYTWAEGATFDAAIIKAASPTITVAEMQGAAEQYNVVTASSVTLDFHDVFRRVSDGATFRVTGYTRDSQAPDASTVKITKVTAERWVVPA